MTKVYVMESCPDCTEVKQRYSNDEGYQLIDIGRQARVIISLKRYDAALTEISPDANADASAAPDSDDSAEHPSYAPGASCSLDGSGC